jgi:hypothetical protein
VHYLSARSRFEDLHMARCADTYEAGKGIIPFIGNNDLVSLLASLKAGVER